MAEKSYPLNNTKYLAEDVQIWFATRTQGVFSADTSLNVTPISNMTIQVGKGIAWMKFDEFENAVYANTTELQHTLELSDNLLPRIDRLVVRWDKVTNDIKQVVKKGTPSSQPIAPMIERTAQAYEIVLADIRVNPGALQITASNIMDRRLNENLCGIMRDGVTGIPSQQLYDAWWAWFNELKQNAETKANEFIEWISIFKLECENNFILWFNSFVASNTQLFVDWYNSFTTQSENTFNNWFTLLQNTLDENQASNLFNLIDQHKNESLLILPNGVHGLRFKDNNLQINIGAGWAKTNITLIKGFTADTFNNMQFTASTFNLMQFTANTFNNYIITEV